MSWLTNALNLLRRTVEECLKDNTSLLAAALAFYTVLSLAPTLLVAVAVAGSWFGRASAQAEVVSSASEFIGPGAARLISGVLEQVEARSSAATMVGIGSMLFAATVAFGALQDSLNLIWGVPSRKQNAIKGFFMKRLLSFGMVLLVGVLLFASLMAGAMISGAAMFVPESLPASELLLQLANFTVSLLLMTVLFAAIYKFLPDAVIHWRDVWIGAAFTAFLFAMGKTLIGLYLGHTSLGSAYGAAGSLVVFLAWIYYSAQIFLAGAEFTEVYAHEYGHSITPRFGEARQAAQGQQQ